VGRLFWKFFLFIWLAQVAGMIGTGVVFWLERPGGMAPGLGPAPPFASGAPPDGTYGQPPHRHAGEAGPGHRPPPLPGIPPLPVLIGGLLVSLLCAAVLAWYVALPVRRLKAAFAGAADGDLKVRIGDGMGRRRDELADLGRDFDRMASRLEAVMVGQQRLLHDVSHELRSPLARLQAAIGLARQQPARLDDSLARIEREGERMNVLVGELLTLSRLEAGVGGALEAVDLGELLGGLVDDARFEAAARQIRVDLIECGPLLVMANPPLLQRAIENVVRNALRFSPGGACVRLETTLSADGRCRIAVSDQGPGVPESELAAIFQPFHRGGAPGDGYGLGLAIARRVIAAVDGEISAKNLPEGGFQVVIELPGRTASA